MCRSPLSRQLLLAALLLATALSGCGLEFEIHETGDPVTIEGQGLLCPPIITSWMPASFAQMMQSSMARMLEGLATDVSEEIEAKNTGPASIVTLSSLSLQMIQPPKTVKNDNSFGFLKSLTIYAEGKAGAPKILLANAPIIPEKATRIDFQVSDQNIQAYVEQGMTATLKFKLRACPRSDVVFAPTYGIMVGL